MLNRVQEVRVGLDQCSDTFLGHILNGIINAAFIPGPHVTPSGGTPTDYNWHLFVNSPVINRDTKMTDFAEASFAGYTPAGSLNIGGSAIQKDDRGRWCALTGPVEFDANVGANPQAIRGVYWTYDDDSDWCFAGYLPHSWMISPKSPLLLGLRFEIE